MVNVALVGCGRIAKRHAEILGKGEVKLAKLAAVCDLVEEKAKDLGRLYDVPYYTDMDEMMRSEEIDLVTVLTESGNHATHTVELAKYGKHIMVEKPMALNLNDAEEMIKACDENNCRLFVVKQNRFNPSVLKLHETISKGKFGKFALATVRLRWSRDQAYYDQHNWRGKLETDGGVLSNQASHYIDLLRWLMGDVESVFAKGITALVNIEAEDTAAVVLKFKNGALGIIEATTAVRPDDLEGSVSIFGANGNVEISGIALNKIRHWNFKDAGSLNTEDLSKLNENPPDVYGFGHIPYYNDIIDAIINNKKSMIDGYEGKKSMELISAIYQSIKTGKEVFLKN
jgi:predicted dehydrogenase